MKTEVLHKVIKYIENSGVDRFTIWCNNSYLIEYNSESTKCVFDDTDEILWFFRVPNGVQPKDFRPIAIECIEYDVIERICVQTDYVHSKKIATEAGLTIPEETEKWLRVAASQTGLYPIQNERLAEDDKRGYMGPDSKIPTVH